MTKITYIKLVNFNCFPLMENDVFEHHFTNDLTMFTGPNGAGKSSIFKELSPLPSDKALFSKGGYKEIHYTHDGKSYVLISDFRVGAKYSFLENGVELNTAGIVTTQRDLAFRLFSINQVVQDILTDAEQFTTMSLLARKKLFSIITHMNIDEVLDGYNQLKETHKLKTALKKHHLSRYKDEESKLTDEVSLVSRKADLMSLKGTIDNLLTIRNEIQQYRKSGDLSTTLGTLKGYTAFIDRTVGKEYARLTTLPRGDIQGKLELNASKLAVINLRLGTTYKDLENVEARIRDMGLESAGDRQQLVERRNELITLIANRENKLDITKEREISPNALRAVQRLEAAIPDIVNDMLPNVNLDGERAYTTPRYNLVLEHKAALEAELTQLLVEENTLIVLKQRLSTTDDVVHCPKCNHGFAVKDSIGGALHTDRHMLDLKNKQASVRSRFKNAENELAEILDYFTRYKQLSVLRQETTDVIPYFWEHVDRNNWIVTSPPTLASVVQRLGLEFSYQLEIDELVREKVWVESQVAKIDAIDANAVTALKASLKVLSQTATDLQTTKREIQEERTELEKLAENYKKLDSLKLNLDSTKQTIRDLALDHFTTTLTGMIDDAIRTKNISVINLEEDMRGNSVAEANMRSIKAELDNLESELNVLSITIDELCPKNGLIAKSVSSFLNMIIVNVNATIRKIWSYKMELKPIDVEADGLNYKFKVVVEDKIEVSDIAVISKGMKEVVDLAFKLVIYKLLDMEHYPLFLDEIASSLDSHHSQQLMLLINSFVGSNRFSQIFLVTHKENFSFIKDIQEISLA